jgi:hypothetical protein
MKTALVCIAKNEDHYINEWVNYHLKIGFDNIFIYQNDWECSIDNPKVTKIIFNGDSKQIPAYNDFIQRYKSDYDWVAFFDVDEFLVLKKHNNINEFLIGYNQYPGVGVNWVMFGNNNLESVTDDYSLIKRFTKRQIGVDPHIKTILNLRHSRNVSMSVHNPNKPIVDSHLNEIDGPFNSKGNDEIIQLNHYFCKTKEEFKLKCERGRSDLKTHMRTMGEYEPSNKNECDDLTALNFLLK